MTLGAMTFKQISPAANRVDCPDAFTSGRASQPNMHTEKN